MTDRHVLTLVWDAWRSAERIQRFVGGRAYDDYAGDEMLRSAVERQFEIIGEALTVLRRKFPETAAKIARLDQAIGLSNVLIYGYAVVDDQRVWDTSSRTSRG